MNSAICLGFGKWGRPLHSGTKALHERTDFESQLCWLLVPRFILGLFSYLFIVTLAISAPASQRTGANQLFTLTTSLGYLVLLELTSADGF